MSMHDSDTAELDDPIVTDESEDLGQANPLELPDEEFLKQGAPVAQDAPVADEADTTQKPSTDETDEVSGASPDTKAVDSGENVASKPAEKVEPKAPEVVKPAGGVDYAAAGQALLAPFKANGREIRVESVEDARSLMQMGANYNKKMQGLKPVMKIAKLLENNGLLDEEKLSFLVDLHAKKPEAIMKLVKDAGLHPMDMDLDKAGDYKPSSHTVDDREMELDAALDDIKDSSHYSKTLSVVREWDAESKKVFGDHPALFKVINDHVERGIYALISAEVDRERTFGRLQGLSDIAAYRQVGDAIQARGGFTHLTQPDGASQGKTSDAGKVVEPKPKKDDDEARNDKRRAMGTPKPAAPSGSTAKDFNPLALSDDEFLKQAAPKFR